MPARPAHLPSQWWPHFVQLRVLFCHPADGGNIPSNWCSKFAVAYSLANPYDGGISHPTGVPSCAVAYFLARPVTRLSHPAGKDNQPAELNVWDPVPFRGEKVSFCTFCVATFRRRAPGRTPIYSTGAVFPAK